MTEQSYILGLNLSPLFLPACESYVDHDGTREKYISSTFCDSSDFQTLWASFAKTQRQEALCPSHSCHYTAELTQT